METCKIGTSSPELDHTLLHLMLNVKFPDLVMSIQSKIHHVYISTLNVDTLEIPLKSVAANLTLMLIM